MRLPDDILADRSQVLIVLLVILTVTGAFLPAERAFALGGMTGTASDRPEALEEISDLIVNKRDYVLAEQRAPDVLPEIEAHYGADSPQVAWTLDLLVEALWSNGRSENTDAHELAQRAVRIKEERFGGRSIEYARSLRHLAIVLEETGRWEEARKAYERIIHIRERSQGADHLDVSISHQDLAHVLRVSERYDSARKEYEKALEIQRAQEADLEVARTLGLLAGVLQIQGDGEGARSRYEEALSIREGESPTRDRSLP